MPASETKLSEIWKIFLRKHWSMLASFVVGAILVSIGAILVYLWYVGYAQLTELVPATLGLWTMGYLVTFLLHVILLPFLLIGVPIILATVAILWQWWKKLPDEEKKEYKRAHFPFGTRSRTTNEGSGISLLIFIAFCIKVYIDGNWNVAFATWTWEYVVYSYLSILLWGLIIFGIPIALGIIWWINHEMKKNS